MLHAMMGVIAQQSGGVPNNLLTGLISYYEAEGNANDSHGLNDGTTNNITYSNDTIQGSHSFSNSGSGFINAGNNFVISSSNQLSFFGRVKTTSSTFIAIAGKRQTNTSNQRNWLFRIESGGQIRFFTGNGGSGTNQNVQGSTNVKDGDWHHVGFIWNTGSCTVYVDGVSEGTNGSMNVGTTSLDAGLLAQSGSSRTGSAGLFDGLADEIGVRSRTLDQTEITTLYNNGVGLPYSQFTN